MEWFDQKNPEKYAIPNIFNKEEMNTIGVINDHCCEKRQQK